MKNKLMIILLAVVISSSLAGNAVAGEKNGALKDPSGGLLDGKDRVQTEIIEKNLVKLEDKSDIFQVFQGYVINCVWDEELKLNLFGISSDPEGQNFVGWIRFPLSLGTGTPQTQLHYTILQNALVGRQSLYIAGYGGPYAGYIDNITSILKYATQCVK